MRLFVGLDLPEDTREGLRNVQARLKAACAWVLWARPEGMHVTLKFIGNADEAKAGAIRAALGGISSPGPVRMRFRGLGFFPNERRPRVLWCGVEGTPNLEQLATDVERSLEHLGVEREARTYAPHLTLARISSAGGAEKLVRAVAEIGPADFGSAEEAQFYLYESILRRSGAKYKKLAEYSFVRDAA